MPALHSFSSEEMSQRLAAIRAALQASDCDALLTSNQYNVRYVTGFRGEPHTLFLSQTEAILFTSFRTLPWAREQTRAIEGQLETQVESSLEESFRRLGSCGCILGVDRSLSHSGFLSLQQKLPNQQLKLCSAIEKTRRCKSPAEIEFLIQSQRINEAIFQAVLPLIRPGMTERAVQGLFLSEMARREEVDRFAFEPIVATGGNAWEIHHLPDDTPIQKNNLLLLDLGVVFQGYASDMTRTVALGKPTSEMRDIYQCVGEAGETAIAEMRPGASTRDVDSVAREVIAQTAHAKSFTHGLGHSIGLETHDPALNLSPDAPDEILLPGMAFTIEPGIYIPNKFGVRTEDVVIVTEDEPLNITRQRRELIALDF